MTAAPSAAARSWDALLAATGLPRLDARALIEHASGRPREWLLAHGDEAPPAGIVEQVIALAQRRRAGEPLAYLVGFREFRGRRFSVTPAVLIPRPETELLVDRALALLTASGIRVPRVLDLGTGSGAIAITLALERPDALVAASDASVAALEVARNNAARLHAPAISWHLGDWWRALPADSARFDLVVSNPPYIAEGDPHLAAPALRHEPEAALVSGGDGLDAIETILAGARAHLAPLGWLLVEHGHEQGPAVRLRMRDAGFEAIATLRDLEGRERLTEGRYPGPIPSRFDGSDAPA